MISYLKKFIPFAALIALIIFILGFASDFKPVMTFAWICYFVFFVLSIVIHYFSSITMQKKLGSFMGVFFVAIFSKLVIMAIVVLIYKAGHDTTDINFIIPFAIIYFSFLFFETIELVKLSRRSAVNTKPPDQAKKPSA